MHAVPPTKLNLFVHVINHHSPGIQMRRGVRLFSFKGHRARVQLQVTSNLGRPLCLYV